MIFETILRCSEAGTKCPLCPESGHLNVFGQEWQNGHLFLPMHREPMSFQATNISIKDSVDGNCKTPDNSFVFKQVFLFVLIGLALAGQGIASPMSCSSLAKSDAGNMEMSHCSEMNMDRTADDSKRSKDCCGSDCTAMLLCSQTAATFLGSTTFAETIAVKAMSHALRPLGKPAGMHSIPEIKPPITV